MCFVVIVLGKAVYFFSLLPLSKSRLAVTTLTLGLASRFANSDVIMLQRTSHLHLQSYLLPARFILNFYVSCECWLTCRRVHTHTDTHTHAHTHTYAHTQFCPPTHPLTICPHTHPSTLLPIHTHQHTHKDKPKYTSNNTHSHSRRVAPT